MSIKMNRRSMLRSTLGLSGAALASIATGLPVGFLQQPLAHADYPDDMIDPERAQYLILSGRDSGDPFNANVPGTYGNGTIIHAADPSMAKTDINLGTVATSAAACWATMPQWALDRSSFIHHATKTQVHGHLIKVLQLLGDAYRNETIPSIYAKHLRSALGTVSATPVPVGGVNLSFDGRTLPQLKPTTLRELLVAEEGPLQDLQGLRDETLDEMQVLLRAHGNTAQRKFLHEHANARADVRELAEGATDLLVGIEDDAPSAQIRAAVALIKLKLTPVAAISLPFGSDNHNDQGLAKEVAEYTAGVGYIAELMNLLEAEGLQDKVTFASINVFGRTLKSQGTKGRNHWSKHHATMMIGRYVQPSVIGGLVADSGDFAANGIDSMTGMGSDSGDITYDEGLASVGKTLGSVLGLSDETLDVEVLRGKVITAAVAE
jgi:hypothetical protein